MAAFVALSGQIPSSKGKRCKGDIHRHLAASMGRRLNESYRNIRERANDSRSDRYSSPWRPGVGHIFSEATDLREQIRLRTRPPLYVGSDNRGQAFQAILLEQCPLGQCKSNV